MKKAQVASILLAIFIIHGSISGFSNANPSVKDALEATPAPVYREIAGNIRAGQTLFDIFKKHELDTNDLYKMNEACADLHRLREVRPNRPYKITLDDQERIQSFMYWIDDDTILNIIHDDDDFRAEKLAVQYERKTEYIGGAIKDNLVSSLGNANGGLLLALQLSDIFAWDIDFTTDIRKNDMYKIVVEGLYLDGQFKKFGDIVAAEFVNDGQPFRAYRYDVNGKAGYFNEEGKSVRKAFLKAPLNFRSISSFFSKQRKHPILKISRPHHGLDYAAPTGTPVSVAGDGKVFFAGHNGQYGKLVIVKHRNDYKTFYGHLSRIANGIRTGGRVEQGQIIGYVGSTGLATGPHLHYEMRVNDKPVNPLSIKIPSGSAVPENRMPDFLRLRNDADVQFASTRFERFSFAQSSAPMRAQ